MLASTYDISSPTAFVTMVLDNLGHTSDDIAHRLLDLGVCGVRNTVRFHNPLVRYLQAEFMDHFQTKVFMDVIKGDILRILFLNGEKQEVALADATVDFLEGFDRGYYPELEEKFPRRRDFVHHSQAW